MKKSSSFLPVLRNELWRCVHSGVICSVCAAFVFTANLLFFVVDGFFNIETGTSSMRSFFNFLPYISILVIPAFTMNSWKDRTLLFQSLPLSDMQVVLAKWTGAFAVCLFCTAALIPSVLIVQRFGDVNIPAVLSSFFTIVLFFGAAAALCQFLALKLENPVLSFFVCSGILFISNIAHFLPLYVSLNSVFSGFCRLISFAWHFDAASKGIIDTRDCLFFVALTCFFLLLSLETLEARKKKRRTLRVLLLCAAMLLFLLDNSLYYRRIDVTKNRLYSLSEETESVLGFVNEPLQITYYLTDELKDLYPQVRDVEDFLRSYETGQRNISVKVVDPSKKGLESALENMGIRSQQLQTTEDNRVSFVTVYSSVLLEYGGKSAVIPFVLSQNTLEYDVTGKIRYLTTGYQRKILIMYKNLYGFDGGEYQFVEPWLESAGFETQRIDAGVLYDEIPRTGTALMVFGSSGFTDDEAAAVENWVKNGGAALFAVSPNTCDITSSWKVTPRGKDPLLELIDFWGIKVENTLVEDISNYRLRMYSSNDTTQFIHVNYPLWIVSLPQYVSEHPVTQGYSSFEAFWASPLTLYPTERLDVVPLISTTPRAWLQKADRSHESPFVTNPFVLEQMSGDQSTTGQYVLAACAEGEVFCFYELGYSKKTRFLVIGDQYFASNVIENTGSSGNLDFLTTSALWLCGEDETIGLKTKGTENNFLYKIDSDEEFSREKTKALICLLFAVPFGIVCIFLVAAYERRSKNLRMKVALAAYGGAEKHEK